MLGIPKNLHMAAGAGRCDPHFPGAGLSSPSAPSSLTDSAVSCTERYLRELHGDAGAR